MPHQRAGLSLVALGSLAACAVPTEAPKYETDWNVPAKSTTISVNSFLPAGVTASADNSAFQVTVSPSTSVITRSLGQDCAACAAANGLTVPKPAFTGGGTSNVALPSAVGGVTLVRDTLTVSITNGYNFDPIRPAGGSNGYLVIRIVNGATTIGVDSIDGSSNVLLSQNTTVVRKIPLSGTITGANGLQITTTLNSPAGGPVTMNSAATFTASGSIGTLSVSSAQVSITNQSVPSTPTSLDLSGVNSIGKHVGAGTLLLTIMNPFNVSGTLTVNFAGGTMPVTKTVGLAAGTSTPSISLTQAEVQSLFGHNITVTISGVVNGSNVVVRPGQVVSVTSRLQVAILVGSTN